MSDSNEEDRTNFPPTNRPPPPENIPPDKKAVWVVAHASSKGKHIPGKWRVINRRVKPNAKKRGPKLGQPRMTNVAHASYVLERLDPVVAFIQGIALHNRHPYDDDLADILRICRHALYDARSFINRFTTSPPLPDEAEDE